MVPRRSSQATGLVALLGLSACLKLGREDARPGDPLGTFHIGATTTANTCGEGALGSAPSWEFDVKLSKDETHLFWDNGIEVLSGELGADGASFSFTSGTITNMRPPPPDPDTETTGTGPVLPPCSLQRVDAATGSLTGAVPDVTALAGALSYAYAPTPDSSCDDLVYGPAPMVYALPCSISYSMTGARTEAP